MRLFQKFKIARDIIVLRVGPPGSSHRDNQRFWMLFLLVWNDGGQRELESWRSLPISWMLQSTLCLFGCSMFNIVCLQHGLHRWPGACCLITRYNFAADNCLLSDRVFYFGNLSKFPELLSVLCKYLILSSEKVTQRWTSLILIKIWVRISELYK